MMDLEAKNKISALQLGLLVFTSGVGSQIITLTKELIGEAQQAAWISTLLGGVVFYFAAYLMLKLGRQFPQETLAEYMPKLWGNIAGGIILWLYNMIFIILLCLVLASMARIMCFFLLDKTPYDIVSLTFLSVIIYGAMQKFGTLIRFHEFIFFLLTPPLILLWLLNFLNFNYDFLLPFIPNEYTRIFTAVPITWNMYAGYEVILLILPWVARGRISLEKAVGIGFILMTAIFVLTTIMTVGVLTVASARQLQYPNVVVLRAVELPGTFVERLENYFLVAWVPIVADGYMLMLYIAAQVCRQHYGYTDHRPWLLLLSPLIFAASLFLYDAQTYTQLGKLTQWLGIGFSFIIVPISLLLARQKREKHEQCL